MQKFTIASRSSRLALSQVGEAINLLNNPDIKFEILSEPSLGDKQKHLSLLDSEIPSDFFTREQDEALINRKADFAVHSAKDLGLPLPPDFKIYALLPAFDKTDALILPKGKSGKLHNLKKGALIGTSSASRKNQLEKLRPDLKILSIRGTIEERLSQLDKGDFDAIICATCALKRLELDNRITEILDFETHPLQGHLAIIGLRNKEDLDELWREHDIRRAWGRVYLVGAGPGDIELLTLKADRLIRSADIIFNDSLANARLLDGARAETHFVGKRGDTGGELQSKINNLLYEAAIAGKQVVRLKGGDPMLFGRATEEMDYLEARLVEVEIVPGISSAVAASAYTQIPLTEREISSSVSLCLGYPPERIPTPNSDTLVYYMGSGTLSLIVAKNLAAGRNPETPVALIQNASLPEQRLWIKTLGELEIELAKEPNHPYASPLLIFMGDVVRKNRMNNWFEKLPRIWYTGTNPDHFTRPARLIHRPLISIQELKNFEILDTEIQRIEEYDWILFTSRHTVEIFFKRVAELGLDARKFATCKIAAIGKATASKLLEYGIRANFTPIVESSVGFVNEHKILPGKKLLLPASDKSLPTIEMGLSKFGVIVNKIKAYENIETSEIPVGIFIDELDEVILTSPSTAQAFHRLFPQIPEKLILRPIGDQTLSSLKSLYPGRIFGKKLKD